MATIPEVTSEQFEDYSGLTLSSEEDSRVEILLGRARRNLRNALQLPDNLDGDDVSDLTDAVAELAWYYWEREKAGVMEIAALPLSPLSLGTLFWTKERGNRISELTAVAIVMDRWGGSGRLRVSLDDEIDAVSGV